MEYLVSHIARILDARSVIRNDVPIDQLLLDSRKVQSPERSIFFALKGFRRDGHQFISDLYDKGVKTFVISDPVQQSQYDGANFLLVKDTLAALQQLAAAHRRQFTIPVIGITGSNGKTIVKEWLYQLLQEDYNIVRSPKSYNSQIGVPLSVWQMNEQHTLAIFEAGISMPGEMEKLETIICPTIALITNIGEAHSEGFASKEEKKKEKEILLRNALQPPPLHSITVEKKAGHATITALKNPVQPETIRITIPFTDDASIDNAISCWRILLMLGYDNAVIDARMKYLQPINMRLELKKGVNGCSVINDSYSADISSLEIALDFLEQQGSGQKRTVILSDFLQSSMDNRALYTYVLEQLKRHQVNRLIGIGEHIAANLPTSPPGLQVESFVSTDDFIRHFRFSTFKDEVILVKGARIFAFERIVKLLEQKVHETVLEINLSGIVHNLKQYQHHLHPSTKVMAMVKAFAYGSGGAEIAGILQYHKVDYLGVAYADEGVELRKAGVTLPIMVMNPEDSAFDAIVEFGLEPELYSIEMLKAFDEFLKQEGIQHYPVHIEIETGMNRLGFSPQDIHTLAQSIKATTSFRVMSAFSHLAASEEPEQDAFTGEQFHLFNQASLQLQEALGYPFIRHIANSAAAIRHPHLQLDMVRLGIGLYGVDSASTGQLHLQPVATLKSTIAQIKHLKKGDSVSYNRRLIVDRDTTIATIRIGYADGYPRRLGNGRGKVLLRGQEVPVSGTICMDMFMVDITSVPGAQEGDEVVLFGKQLPVQQVAKWAETIPYEIMTGISQRVKRVYFQE